MSQGCRCEHVVCKGVVCLMIWFHPLSTFSAQHTSCCRRRLKTIFGEGRASPPMQQLCLLPLSSSRVHDRGSCACRSNPFLLLPCRAAAACSRWLILDATRSVPHRFYSTLMHVKSISGSFTSKYISSCQRFLRASSEHCPLVMVLSFAQALLLLSRGASLCFADAFERFVSFLF